MSNSSLIQKVELRPLRADDAAAFMSWGGDPAVTASLFWDHYQNVADAQLFLATVAEKHPWFMAIVFNGQAVGAITLDQGKGRAECRAELGYVVAKTHWGRGVATEAVRQTLSRGFADLKVQRIEALVDPQNLGSKRVLEKSGMALEATFQKYVIHRGHVRDRLVYAAYKP